METSESSHADPAAAAFEVFSRIETELETHRFQIEDVFPWSAMRREIYERILVTTGTMAKFQADTSTAQRTALATITNTILRNPYFRFGKKKHLVIPWTRKQKIGSSYRDTISSAPLRHLVAKDVLQMDASRQLIRSNFLSTSLEAINFTSYVGEKFSPVHVSKSQSQYMEELERVIEREFSVRLPFRTQMPRFAGRFQNKRRALARLLRRWQIQNIIMVVAYGLPEVCAAARDAGARVVELQHGIVGRYLVGYDYAPGIQPAYVPDYILTFGNFWNKATRFSPQTRPLVYGAPHIRERLDAANKEARREPSMLFISQPGISEQLLNFAIEFSALPGAPASIFRLHPGDDENRIRKMTKTSGTDASRLAISAGGGAEKTLYLQSVVGAQVGVFSTAVFEGLAMGCRTFVAPLPGRATLDGLVSGSHAESVNTPADLLFRLRGREFPAPQFTGLSVDDLFAKERPEVLSEALL